MLRKTRERIVNHRRSESSLKLRIDTDPTFLTALASRKGKMAEDDFDRGFNN
ncbi:hypothetical protein OG21DRAFT_1515987 [Imleria badia]|nr:hypothetical protein OG21DRAFT_1515987 [Imleria badia]